MPEFSSMPTELALIIAGFILLVGTITDLKTREVPDWLNFAGIAAGIGIILITAITTKSYQVLITGGIGFGVFMAIGFLMYYAGQWGGGDSKLMMALGALLGLEFSLEYFSVAFLVNMLLVGAVYGLLWVFVLAFKNRHKLLPEVNKLAKQKGFVWARIASFSALIILGTASLFVDDKLLKIVLLLFAFFFPFLTYVSLFIKSVEKCCMVRLAKPSELTEGDWIAKDVIIKGKRITGPKDLGITKSQIAELQKHKIKVLVKDGIPFVPSFLIAFLLTLWIGNPLFLIA